MYLLKTTIFNINSTKLYFVILVLLLFREKKDGHYLVCWIFMVLKYLRITDLNSSVSITATKSFNNSSLSSLSSLNRMSI